MVKPPPSSDFYNYPLPKSCPSTSTAYATSSNPVLRGSVLAVAATIVASSSYVQRIFYRLNAFDKLKDIPELHDYNARYDPTVIPAPRAEDDSNQPFDLTALPAPPRRRNQSGYYTCADYQELYRSGKLTPTEVAEALLPLISRESDPPGEHSVAFLESKAKIVLAAAAASTARYAAGKPLSVLDGVPLAVKDEADLDGYSRTLGSKIDFTNPDGGTAWCVAKWEEAGGVVIGKTSMHELGMDTTNNNPNVGTPLNPHNNDYYTGGSSGGSAYVVASGICPIALGLDGGGSIRLPSAFCGIYGLKPSQSRVSGRPTRDHGSSVTVYGPVASSIDDLALAYRIMAQPDPQSRGAKFPQPHASLDKKMQPGGGKKYLGVCGAWTSRADPKVRELFDKAVEHYVRTQGYEKVEITLPFLAEGQKAHALTILSEARSGITAAQIAKLTYPNQVLLSVAGGHASAQDFLYCQRLRDLQMRHLAALWEKHPGMVVCSPTTPCAGWKVGHKNDVVRGGWGVMDGDMSLRSMEYVWLANWTGTPAISFPMGYSEDGVPVGIMGMGIWGSEEQLIEFGREGAGVLGEEGCRKPKEKGNFVDILTSIRN